MHNLTAETFLQIFWKNNNPQSTTQNKRETPGGYYATISIKLVLAAQLFLKQNNAVLPAEELQKLRQGQPGNNSEIRLLKFLILFFLQEKKFVQI